MTQRHSASRGTLTFFVIVALVAVGATLTPTSATAEEYKNAADEAEVQFTLGNEAYIRRDFRTALAHYFASNRLAPNRNVTFNIARAYEQLGQFPEAFRYYQDFASETLTDKERSAVDDAMKRVLGSVALLSVQSDPPGATLYIDRKDLGGYGTTPRLLAVKPGSHDLIFELAGHESATVQGVSLRVGRTETVRVSLPKILGRLEVTGTPAGAEIVLEGPARVTGTMPGAIDAPPGRYRVTARQSGYLAWQGDVEIVARKTAAMAVELQRQTGTLVVQADERDALILVDGRAAGFTPAVIDGVPAGPHDVSVVLDGFRTWSRRIDVAPDERTVAVAELDASDEVAAASKTSESASDAPASVSLVPSREIAAFGAMTVAEALGAERGVFFSDDGSYPILGIRGFAPFVQYGNRLLVQIDGHTVNDDWIGSSFVTFDLMNDLDRVERLELVRGPGSVLYGTGAFFGVVNVVTHDDAPRHPVTAGLTAVTDGTIRAKASGGMGFEGGGFWVSGGGIYGQPGTYVSPALGADGTANGVGEFSSGTAQGRVFWRDLTVQFYFNERNKGVETGAFDTLFGDSRFTLDDRRAFVEARYEPTFGPGAQLFSRVYYDHSGYEGRLPYAPGDDGGLKVETFTGNWLGLEARGVFRPLASADDDGGLRITAGLEYQYHFENTAKGTDDTGIYMNEEHPFSAFSAYALVDWTPWRFMGLSVGGRFDGWLIDDLKRTDEALDDRFLYSINPRFALLFHPTDGSTLKLLGGKAFRAPSIYELTYSDGGVEQDASPDLVPETIWTGEIEYSHELPWELRLTASAFMNHIEDLIQLELTDETEGVYSYQNTRETVWTVGAEFELQRELARGWMVSAQYSFQRTRLGDISDGESIPNSPEHLIGFKVIAPIARPSLLLASRLQLEVDRRTRDGEEGPVPVLWDVVLSGAVTAAHLEYAVGVRNLLDWTYGHPVGDEVVDLTVRQPGRTLFADVTFFW
ncbi:MAG: TonB-dependent receptor [Myxococcales bacterium]|nr:TonB-dependent receptor [Myxococcales bacterium]